MHDELQAIHGFPVRPSASKKEDQFGNFIHKKRVQEKINGHVHISVLPSATEKEMEYTVVGDRLRALIPSPNQAVFHS